MYSDRLCRIERTTAKQVILKDGDRFWKGDGLRVGVPKEHRWPHCKLEEATTEAIKSLKRWHEARYLDLPDARSSHKPGAKFHKHGDLLKAAYLARKALMDALDEP